jgi:hypothetical protein
VVEGLKRRAAASGVHRWEFKARFRRQAFGWRSQPAVLRVRQAVAEINKVARKDSILGAEGAVTFLERVSPALENVDSSSGAIGTAVNNAIESLVSIIAVADVDARLREGWLDRLWNAIEADEMPYIEELAAHWGELCASREIASAWADRLIDTTRLALSPDPGLRGHFKGTIACLSALCRAGRHAEIIEVLERESFWRYKRWAVKAMAAMGQAEEAIALAEASRGPWTSDWDVDQICEEILLAAGRVAEAYERYGLSANRRGTNLATLRAVARKYPDKSELKVLADLIATTPGEEGKWFAAAKEAGFYDEALALASRSPCDPTTLTRAARDFVKDHPAFALGAGLLALHWLIEGYRYEITSADVWDAYARTMAAAEAAGKGMEIRAQVAAMVAAEPPGSDRFVHKVLGRELGL